MKQKKELATTMLESMEFNLCDFALFLSVMKNKEAHEITLRIIMDDPTLCLDEIHVEEIVLNKSGKRAIRLDAWAKDTEGMQYNTEMQTDISTDDIRKRSRFYQGLIDTPVLKSGKTTKYKQLPSTVIIFITKEDIFGQDLAKYTFTEQCEEIAGFHLDDGTTKIFLNMSSKNGSQELINLLQYMKDTRLDNPNLTTPDEHLQRLDFIVNEVKNSEEWEAVSMSIFSVAHEHGMALGRAQGRVSTQIELICKKLRKGKSIESISDELDLDIDTILPLFNLASKFAPDYEPEKVIDAWIQMANDK